MQACEYLWKTVTHNTSYSIKPRAKASHTELRHFDG